MSAADSVLAVEYRPVDGFSGYRVGDDGSVWTNRRRREWKRLKPFVDRDGYERVHFWRDGVQVDDDLVHRVVLKAFVGPCPSGCVAAHNNGNRRDNRVSNLRWSSQKENVADKLTHGTHQCGERHGCHVLTERAVKEIRCLSRLRIFTQKRLAVLYRVSKQTIEAVCQRRLWKHVA